jgi:hypothetical protein
MPHSISDFNEDLDTSLNDLEIDPVLRKSADGRRKLEDYLEEKRLKEFLADDYDFDIDDD